MNETAGIVEGDAPPQGAKGQHLRDFEAHLAERLRHAGEAQHTARLGLLIGEQPWLVELSEAGEIVAIPSTIAPVPLAREWFRGLVNLRGMLFGVTDLQRFAGGPPTAVTKESRLLAFGASLNVDAAIVVSRMLGLHDPSDWQVDDSASPQAQWVGRSLIDSQGRRWNELSLARLAADEQFLCAAR